MQIVKLGGSVITNKKKEFTPRRSVIDDLSSQMRNQKLIVTHGSGSFGHFMAKRYGISKGFLKNKGFGAAKVHDAAAKLNRIVISYMLSNKIPAVSLPPSASMVSESGKLSGLKIDTFNIALKKGLVPVTYGDVIMDSVRGCCIASTEDLIYRLSQKFKPKRIIMCTDVDGVLVDGDVVDHIDRKVFGKIKSHLKGSSGVDVTGGMVQKIQMSLDMAKYCDVFIINGKKKGNLKRALLGQCNGTKITR